MIKIIKKNGYFEICDRKKNIFILTKKYLIGKNVFLGERIKICNHDGSPMESLVFGDNIQIHHDSTIMVSSFSVMDYTKINNNFYAHGINALNIGYNCWLGRGVTLDTLGKLLIGNNVCLASYSQVYSHAKFGDVLFGCNINSCKNIKIEDDVWVAPSCIITMASMAPKSMLLAGSVLTKDTIENHIYAETPACDISDKIGFQFNEKLNFNSIYKKLNEYLDKFCEDNINYQKNNIKICIKKPEKLDKNITYFVLEDRKYTKRLTDMEIDFIKFLLPDRGKFIPY